MTRFARGKSTHQRVEGESTSWSEFKDNVQQEQDKGPKKGIRRRNDKHRDRVTDNKEQEQESANFTPLGQSRGQGKGKQVKIFGNFWVLEEDGKRLKSMAKRMKEEGIGRKEILKALQNERRKAEKTARRKRDKTCFNCRQFGHVLAECPNLKEEEQEGVGMGMEICFKCGSMEHTSKMCKKKTDKFAFAKCFICSKSGHIARQCPNNEKGIYPGGGCCDECGLKTHLKKDCPQLLGQSEGLDKNEEAQVVGRIANPFQSTEYEELEDDKKDKKETMNMDVEDQTDDKLKQKKNKRRKSEVEGQAERVDKIPPQPQTKKRKIVKF